MKRTLVQVGLILLTASMARADFDPVPLTPGSFTADVVVEKTAPQPFRDYTTASQDGGTNNDSNVWFERGYDPTRPGVGLPPAGSTFTAQADANRTFRMAASYATNNAVLLTTNGHPTATVTFTAPAAASVLSVLNTISGGNTDVSYTVHYQGGATQAGTISFYDWFDNTAATIALMPGGRVNVGNGQMNQGSNAKIFYSDIFLSDTTTPVTHVVFTTTSGNRIVLLGVSRSTDGSTFTPATVSGFNRDMVVEATAPVVGSLLGHNNVIMDSGATNLTGNTWYEMGFHRGAPLTGLPLAGTNISGGNPLMTFTMPANYAASNVLYLGNYDGYKSGTLTLNSPAPYTSLSFLNAAGNGPAGISATIYYADSTSETIVFSSRDWFNQAGAFYTTAGRFHVGNLGLNDVNSSNPDLHTNIVQLANTESPVTHIDFLWGDGGRSMIFAVAGQSNPGGVFSPVTVSGFNADGVVERSANRFTSPYYASTTATMDGGTNFSQSVNNLNTWYEAGYYRGRPDTGLPPAGSLITSLALPDHHYRMPPSYTANNAVFVDATITNANLTLATPATYSALSFLSTCANGRVTNQVVMQYMDGTSETNTFVSQDWFGQTPYAFTSRGRVDVQRQTLDNVGSDNPRLYEAQFALANTSSPVTNIVLRFLGSQNANGRMFVFAVSGTAGAVPPIILSVSATPTGKVFEGSVVTFNAVITGGTTPISYQWQKGTNNVFVDVVNGGNVSGATTTNLVITPTLSDAADYRLVAFNSAGTVNSATVTMPTLLSTLSDVTAPGDNIQIYAGSTPFSGETVPRAIDNDTAKYLSVDPDDQAPFDPVGFVVQPSMGNTIVSALRFYTANDAEGRDPSSFTLEGSLDGANFNPITSGALALPAGRNAGGSPVNPLTQNIQEVRFANAAGYSYYRLTLNTTKENGTLMQIGEVEFLGVVNPNSPPNFVVSPTNTMGNEGASATFYSTAVGPGPITYQWYNVTAGEPGVAIGGQTGQNLTLNGLTLAQNGTMYRVVATNPYGSTTNPATILPAAQLTVSSGGISYVEDLPAEILFYVGRTVSLHTVVSGTAPSYQWQKDGVNLVNNARFSGVNSNILTIANIQFGDQGVYRLLSSNEVSGVASSVESTVSVAAVAEFNDDGLGWTVNNGGLVSGDVFFVTSAGNQRTSGFFNTPLYIGGFEASFLYQDVETANIRADGIAFVLHNATEGASALGGGGGGVGYSGINPSAAILFNIYTNGGAPSGFAFTSNGITGGTNFTTTGAVNIDSGDPIQINIRYTDGTLSLSFSNQVTAATFRTNLFVGDLSVPAGGSTAYVGITGASGGFPSQQRVSNFRYVPLPTADIDRSGSSLVLTWPASVGGYAVQSRTNLATGAWAPVNTAITQSNNLNRATVTPAASAEFFRLALPVE
ncbi:MAG TPA: hypothetical protein VEH04_18460 [Verrucomicrobiae bacterium]|nr:hypothetical protein [Verrucomicrobiae bacterium]